MAMILAHQKSSVKEGWQTLFRLFYTVAGMGVFQYFFFPVILDDGGFYFIVFWIVLEVLVVIMALCYSIYNIHLKRAFICTLSDSEMTCQFPAKSFGENFSLPLSQIARIEESQKDDQTQWYLWDQAGKRYHIPENYGNPVRKFIEHLKRMKPEADYFRS